MRMYHFDSKLTAFQKKRKKQKNKFKRTKKDEKGKQVKQETTNVDSCVVQRHVWHVWRLLCPVHADMQFVCV